MKIKAPRCHQIFNNNKKTYWVKVYYSLNYWHILGSKAASIFMPNILLIDFQDLCILFMSPVSPVFRTVVTVSIGLKNMLKVGTSILKYWTSI